MLAHLFNKMWNRNFKKWNSRRIQRNRKKMYPGEGSVLGSFLLLNRLLQQTQPREKGLVLAWGLRAWEFLWGNGDSRGCSSWLLPVHSEDTAMVQALLFSPHTVQDPRQGIAPPTESRSFPHLWMPLRWSPKAFPESYFPGDSGVCQVDS